MSLVMRRGAGAIFSGEFVQPYSTVTGNTAFEWQGAATDYPDTHVISTAQAIVIARNAADGTGWAEVLDISGNTITGNTEFNYSASVGSPASTLLSTTKAVVGYDNDKAKVLSISGTTITGGTEKTLSGGSSSGDLSLATISSSQCVHASSFLGVRVLNVAGTVITDNTAYTIDGSGTGEPNVAMISPTKAILVYVATGDSSKGKAVILSISGTVITVGTAFAFSSGTNTITAPKVTVLEDNTAVVAWQDTTDSGAGDARALTVTGTTITAAGSIFEFDGGNADDSGITIAKINKENVIVGYGTTGVAATDGKFAQVLNISSGGTITGNTDFEYSLDSGNSRNSVALIENGKAIISYSDATGSNHGFSQILNIT